MAETAARAGARGDMQVTQERAALGIDLGSTNAKALAVAEDGAVVANSGHFDVELDLPGLESISESKREVREYVDEYALENGRKVYVLGEGRLINLAAAEGHPSAVMDMSFANQALSSEYIVNAAAGLENKVYPVPREIDEEVGKLKLRAMGIEIDTLTAEQYEYLHSWNIGT